MYRTQEIALTISFKTTSVLEKKHSKYINQIVAGYFIDQNGTQGLKVIVKMTV